jgi:hypothetical protein
MMFDHFVVFQYYLLKLLLEFLVDDQLNVVMVLMIDDNDLNLNDYQD